MTTSANTMSLPNLLEQARLNEDKLLELQTMELSVLHADSLLSLLDVLVNDYRQRFNLCAVTLSLLDEDNAIAQYLDECEKDPQKKPLVSGIRSKLFLISEYEDPNALPNSVMLTPLTPWHESLFGTFAEAIESVAIIPLIRQGERLGFLALGSVDPSRYNPDMATDFLRRLGAIVSVCLQNVLQLEQLRQLNLTDVHTHLPNRKHFIALMSQRMERAQEQGETVACLMIDVAFIAHKSQRKQLRQLVAWLKANMPQDAILARSHAHRLVLLAVGGSIDVLNQTNAKLIQGEVQDGQIFHTHIELCDTSEVFAEANILSLSLLDSAVKGLSARKS